MRVTTLIILCILSINCFSQVVNIEEKRFTKTEKKLQGNIDLSVNFIKSTSDIVQGNNKIRLQYYKDRTTYLFFNDISLMQVDTQSYLNSGFQHLRYNYDFDNNWLIAEAFTQIQYNKIQKLQRRFLWGAGSRFRILDTTNVSLYSGTSVMYEFELLLEEDYSDMFRLNTYLSARIKIKDNLSFTHITYYQPSLNNFNDYRISSETGMSIKISKKIHYKVAFTYSYDSNPPKDIQNLFYTLNNGISFIF